MIEIYELDTLLGTVELKNGKLQLDQKVRLSTGRTLKHLIDSLIPSPDDSSDVEGFYKSLPRRLNGRIYAVEVDESDSD